MESAEAWACVFVIAMCALYDGLRRVSRNMGRRSAKPLSKTAQIKQEQIAPFDECFEEDDW